LKLEDLYVNWAKWHENNWMDEIVN